MGLKRIAYGIIGIIAVLALWLGPKTLFSKTKEKQNVLFFGDSMVGQVRSEDGIAGLLGQKLNTPICNLAFGGTNMSRLDTERSIAKGYDSLSMVALAEAIRYDDFGPQQTVSVTLNGTDYFDELIDYMENIDYAEAELIFIEHGTNDYNGNAILYASERKEDPYTFEGALRKTLRLVKETAPKARVILVTPTFCWFPPKGTDCTAKNGAGNTLLDYIELEKKIAAEMGIECLDNYNVFLHESDEDCFKYTIDGLHANEYGRELIANAIYEYLNR